MFSFGADAFRTRAKVALVQVFSPLFFRCYPLGTEVWPTFVSALIFLFPQDIISPRCHPLLLLWWRQGV